MSNARRGLPLTSSRIEKIFPKLTPAQISRIGAHGHIHSIQTGEGTNRTGRYVSTVLCRNHRRSRDLARPFGTHETLVTVHGPGEFTGEVNMLSGRRSLVRARATK